MKRLRLSLILAISVFQVFVGSDKFSVATWNVLGAEAPDLESYRHSGSRFSFDSKKFDRFDDAAKILEGFTADIVCLQECAISLTEDPKNLKAERFKKSEKFDYDLVSFMKKGATAGTALFVRSGSLLKQAVCGEIESARPGACAWALFKANSYNVLVASVHIGRANDNSGGKDGDVQWGKIAQGVNQVVASHSPCAVVFAGDFNTFYQEVLNTTRAYLAQVLGSSIEMYQHNSWTANGNVNFNIKNTASDLSKFGKKDYFDLCSIDHVLFTNQLLKINEKESFVGGHAGSYKDNAVAGAKIKIGFLHSNIKNQNLIHTDFPSDHLPVFVSFEFAKPGAATAKIPTTPAAPDPQAATASFNVGQYILKNQQTIRERIEKAVNDNPSGDVKINKQKLFDWIFDQGVANASDADKDKLVDWLNKIIREFEAKKAAPKKSASSSWILTQALELASCLKRK